MGTRDLPDMYALSPRACGPRASGIHIRQITRAHVTTITCILKSDGEYYSLTIIGQTLFRAGHLYTESDNALCKIVV